MLLLIHKTENINAEIIFQKHIVLQTRDAAYYSFKAYPAKPECVTQVQTSMT